VRTIALVGGEHVLQCTAADRWGNVASSSATVKVDFTPPVLGAISFSPQVRRVDQTTTFTIPFIERGSGVSSATVQLGSSTDGPTFPDERLRLHPEGNDRSLGAGRHLGAVRERRR
jgi:hypothetical protein